jgi:hypothetical protein
VVFPWVVGHFVAEFQAGKRRDSRPYLGRKRTMGDGSREIIGQYKCECGAIYKKISTSIVPFSETEGTDCEVCGKQSIAGAIRIAASTSTN